MDKPRFQVRAELPDEVLHKFSIMSSVSFTALHNHLKDLSNLSQITITYLDEEGDKVTLTNEEEFVEAKRALDIGTIPALRLAVTAGPYATPYRKEEPNTDTLATKPQPTPRSGGTGKIRKIGHYPKLAEDLGEELHDSEPKVSVATNTNTETTSELTNSSEWTGPFLTNASREITNVLGSLLKSVTAEPSSLLTTSSNTLCHTGIFCKLCNKTIIGNRYKCGNCAEFDLCELCLLRPDTHDPTHVLLLIRVPCPNAGYIDGWSVPLLQDNLYQPTVRSEDELRAATNGCTDKKMRKMEKKLRKMLPQHVESQVEALKSDIQHKRMEIREMQGKIRSTKKFGCAPRVEEGVVQSSPTQEFSARVIRDKGECVTVFPLSRVSCKWLVENDGQSFWSSVRFHCVSGSLLSDERQISLPFCSQGDKIELEVPFTAPENQGYYYSQWRLSHHGKAFGPPFKAECRVCSEQVFFDKNVEVDSGAEDDEDLASADQGFAIKAFPGAGGMQQPLIAISREDYLEDVLVNSLQALPTEDNDSIDLDVTELISRNDRPNTPLFSDQEFLSDVIVNSASSPPIDIMPTRLLSTIDTASLASSSTDSFIVVQMPDSFDPSKPMYLSQGSETVPAKVMPEANKEQIFEDSPEFSSPIYSPEPVSPSPVPSSQPVFVTHSPQPNVNITSLSSISPMSSIKSFVSSVADKLDDSLNGLTTTKKQQHEEYISSYEEFKPFEINFDTQTSLSSLPQESYTAPSTSSFSFQLPSNPPLSTSQTVNITPTAPEFKFDLPSVESFMAPGSGTVPFQAKPLLTADTSMWLSQSKVAIPSNKEEDQAKWIASKSSFPNFSLPNDEEAWIAPSASWKPKQPSTPNENLMKMGFCNRELNDKLLEKFNNNLERVITALLEESQAAWN